MTEDLARVVDQSPDALSVTKQIVNACSDAKGKELVVLDVSNMFDLANFFVVVSGRSDRQVQGIASRVLETLESSGLKPNNLEGFENGHWVLMDYGDVIVHVFYEPLREHYDLESLWKKAKKVELKRLSKLRSQVPKAA